MKLRHALLGSVVSLVVSGVGALSAQSLLFQVNHPGGADGLTDAEFDLDQDGHGDLLYGGRVYSGRSGELLLDVPSIVGSWQVDVDVFADLGMAFDGVPDFMALTTSGYGPILSVVSGADGTLVSQVPFATTWGDVGRFLRNVGDVNGDGVEDALAGTQWFEGPCPYEMASVAYISGASESPNPWYITTPGLYGSYDWGVRLGDVTGDGRSNFGIRRSCGSGQYAYSVSPGGPVTSIYYAGYTTYYQPDHIAAAGDHNGDGIEDLIMHRPTGANPRRVAIADGVDGVSPIWILPEDANRGVGVGDVDCDGFPDVLLTGGLSTESTTLWSGADRSLLWTAPQRASQVRRIGDIDGDGRADLGLQVGNTMQVWSTATLGARPCKQAQRGKLSGGPVTR